MKKLGVVIVGCGSISPIQAKAVLANPTTQLAGFVSRSGKNLAARIKEFGGEGFSGLAALAGRQDIDIISLCTPSGAHLEDALAAADMGFHVLVEKPLEITGRRCRRIIEACRKKKVRLATVFPYRFSDGAQALKKLMEAGRLGRLVMATAHVKWFRTREYYASDAWRGTRELDGGGCLMNQGIHTLDLLRFMTGPIKKIHARKATLAYPNLPVEDTLVANFELAGGALGILEAATSAYPGFIARLEISGTRGSVILENERFRVYSFLDQDPLDAEMQPLIGSLGTTGGAADPMAISFTGHQRVFAEFAAAILEKRPSHIGEAAGKLSVDLIERIYKSAETGKEVKGL